MKGKYEWCEVCFVDGEELAIRLADALTQYTTWRWGNEMPVKPRVVRLDGDEFSVDMFLYANSNGVVYALRHFEGVCQGILHAWGYAP